MGRIGTKLNVTGGRRVTTKGLVVATAVVVDLVVLLAVVLGRGVVVGAVVTVVVVVMMGHAPGLIEMSSIAISPEDVRPRMPTKAIW